MPTAKNHLSAKEICDILAACERHGVSEMQFGDLSVKRGPKNPLDLGVTASQAAPAPETGAQPTDTDSENAISEAKHDQLNQEALETDELLTREEEIAMLLITDPAKAEEMMRNGELEDADEQFDDE